LKKFSSESIKKILVPIDGSDYSNRAAEYAIGIAKAQSAEVLLVYVVDELVVDQFSGGSERGAVEAELKSDGQRAVHYAECLMEKAGVKSSSLLLKGRPFEQIVNTTKSFDIDLVVMGTYGRRGAERILIGSVAERVIEYSPCPVLVVK
jgi:Universal stress protein UspA and related nucleotide-binding proteins